MAAENGHSGVVTLLLDKGADVDKAMTYDGFDGCTPLIIAVCNGHVDVTRLLLEKGADANKAADDGNFPLKCALNEQQHLYEEPGLASLVEMLLENGADVEQRCNGVVPLTWAAANNHELAAELLLAHGANVNPPADENGFTPLIVAAERGYTDVVKLLLEQKADATKKTKAGKTPLQHAIFYGHSSVACIGLLRTHVA